MVTIQVENLIDFVAEVFSHSDYSPAEAKRIASCVITDNFFDGEISRYVDFIRATKPVTGDAVLIPGDPERKMRADRSRNGVPLPDDTWAAIVNTARDVGASEVSIQRAVS
jgi:hydroxycarboxylate dehydrogenase B